MTGAVAFAPAGAARRAVGGGRRGTAPSGGRRRQGRATTRAPPAMSTLQSPYGEGPPPLDEFFSDKRQAARAAGAASSAGAPLRIGTGRGVLKDSEGDLRRAVDTALARALETLGGAPSLAHVTATIDVDANALSELIGEALPAECPVLGRSIAKEGAEGVVELLLLGGERAGAVVEHTLDGADDEHGVSGAAAAASKLAQTVPPEQTQFLLFAYTPGPTPESVRRGLAEVYGEAVAYGGVATGVAEDAGRWSLWSRGGGVRSGEQVTAREVLLAAVPGTLPFMLSAVVKNWAQPNFQRPLSFMIPKYVGDDALDLLTAIRFNDWERFVSCLESVDVNHRWSHKQNQAPLLAAAGRGRVDMVEYLLRRGADVQARNDGDFTAIMYTDMLTEYDDAIISRQRKLLLDAGAVPEKPKLSTQ